MASAGSNRWKPVGDDLWDGEPVELLLKLTVPRKSGTSYSAGGSGEKEHLKRVA